MPQSLVEIGQKIWKLVRTDRRTDGKMDGRTDRQTGRFLYTPPQTTFAGGIKSKRIVVSEL
jgi:hypothetical protein